MEITQKQVKAVGEINMKQACSNCENCSKETRKGYKREWTCRAYDMPISYVEKCNAWEQEKKRNFNNEIDPSPIGTDGFSILERGL